jgi:hypothetical protein
MEAADLNIPPGTQKRDVFDVREINHIFLP